jgi:hypothetical protein
MRVTSGTCSVYRIVWRWNGARRATAYDVVAYDPQTGTTIRNVRLAGTTYTLRAGPGATVALKVRSVNARGTAPTYFTPGAVGRVPPHTPNPTHVAVSTAGNRLTWTWTAVPHATAYDLVLYHYAGNVAKADIRARHSLAHWSLGVTPGITYYLKLRSVGRCAPVSYLAPSTHAAAGAASMPQG